MTLITRCSGLLILAGALSLQASDATLTLTGWGTGVPGNDNISPYTGNYVSPSSIVTDGIKLYCDDAADESKGIGSTYNVTVTAVTAVNATDSRFYNLPANRFPGFTLPTGTALYEELAWLYTEMQDTTNAAVLTDIQDAAWDLTDSTQEFGDQTVYAEQWGLEAAADYSTQTATSFNDGNGSINLSVANYSDWFVIDAASGVSGSWQEFLTDSTLNSGSPGGGGSSAPEPATFAMLGSALLFIGLRARRK